MSYTWTTGEVITADKLNATGDGGGLFIVHITEDEQYNLVADKTFAEIQEAYNEGTAVVAVSSGNLYPIVTEIAENEEEAFGFYSVDFEEDIEGVRLVKTGVTVSDSNAVDVYYVSVTVEQITK